MDRAHHGRSKVSSLSSSSSSSSSAAFGSSASLPSSSSFSSVRVLIHSGPSVIVVIIVALFDQSCHMPCLLRASCDADGLFRYLAMSTSAWIRPGTRICCQMVRCYAASPPPSKTGSQPRRARDWIVPDVGPALFIAIDFKYGDSRRKSSITSTVTSCRWTSPLRPSTEVSRLP